MAINSEIKIAKKYHNIMLRKILLNFLIKIYLHETAGEVGTSS